MRAILFASLVSLGLLSACGPAAVDGTVGGQAIDNSDAIAQRDSVFGADTLHVVIGGDTADLCQDLASGILHKDASLMEISILTGNLAPGEYDVGTNSGGIVSAHASKLDSACGDILKQNASSGHVTLTVTTGSNIQGSFDLFFGSDHVTGSFTARLCSNTNVDMKSCQ